MISFVISLEPCLISIKALITFIPPPVEPAHAPMNAAIKALWEQIEASLSNLM